MIEVLLADDQVLVRAGFRAILDSADDITVVAEAGDGAEAARLTARHHPHVVLMDIRMPGTDGLAATSTICAANEPAGKNTKVIILTTYESDEYLYAALRAGASGFLVKDTEPEELLHAVRVVVAGDALLSPRITRRLVADVASRPAPPAHGTRAVLATLTNRERQIVGLVAEGLSNIEIAQRLYLSPHTAKTHVNRAMSKLAVRDRAQLVILAYESGLVGSGHGE